MTWTFEGIWPDDVPFLDPDEKELPNGRRTALEVVEDAFEHPLARTLATGVYINIQTRDKSGAWRPRRWFNETMEALGYTEWAKEETP